MFINLLKMSEFLIVLTQYLRLMLFVDSSPWDQRTTFLVTAVSVDTELLCVLKEQDSSLRQEQWPCF